MYLELIAPKIKMKKTRLQKGDKVFFHTKSQTFSARRGDKSLLFASNDDKFLFDGKVQHIENVIFFASAVLGILIDFKETQDGVNFYEVI